MKEKGLTFPTRPSATIIPLDAKTERRPLGLAPVLDDDDRAPDRNGDTPGYLEAKRLIAEAVASLPEAARNQPATIADVFEGLELPLAIEMDAAAAISKSFRELRAEIAELKGAHRNEVAELRLALTEARCEVRELKALLESARTLSRGEAGVPGPRGIPGPPGSEGRTGPQGPKGEAAPMVVGWEADPAHYLLTPIHSTGERGVPANLTGLFEAYNAATEAEDDE
jgi:hypothetical protein